MSNSDFVKFTGLVIDKKTAVFGRRERKFVPSEWDRLEFIVSYVTDPETLISQWIEKNIEGRWALYTARLPDKWQVVVCFEEETAAMMFRLYGGESEWRPESI